MNKKTAEDLKALHAELQQMGAVGEQDREFLEHLRDDIQAVLAQSAKDAGAAQSLRDTLGDAVRRFEVSHPDATKVMAAAIDSLVNIGV